MSLETIEEKSTAYLTVVCLDKDGSPETPSSAEYRADCVTTSTQIKDWTATTPGAAMEITLDKTINVIQTATNEYEKKRITFKAVFGANDESYAQYDYLVHNLSQVS